VLSWYDLRHHTTLSAIYNRGKRSLCLDLKHKDGLAVAKRGQLEARVGTAKAGARAITMNYCSSFSTESANRRSGAASQITQMLLMSSRALKSQLERQLLGGQYL
jgi:hypothetical protein